MKKGRKEERKKGEILFELEVVKVTKLTTGDTGKKK